MVFDMKKPYSDLFEHPKIIHLNSTFLTYALNLRSFPEAEAPDNIHPQCVPDV